MDLAEIEATLAAALPLRSPRKDPDSSTRAHVEALEDYMLQAAQIGGALVEARHWLREVETRLGDEWEALPGWEAALRKRRDRATAAEIKEAKAKSSPQLYDALRRARALRESVTEQIARLEKEADRMSRAYTMVSGG